MNTPNHLPLDTSTSQIVLRHHGDGIQVEARGYCSYYQAHVEPKFCWMMTGILRSFEHLCFDRTIDKEHSVFEFFVPCSHEDAFEEVMRYFEAQNVVRDLKKMENRLMDLNESL